MQEQTRVIVLGGSGMLRPAVTTLVRRGHTVIAAARRPLQLDATRDSDGELIAVHGDWREPQVLSGSVREAAGRQAVQGAIVWVHTPYRRAVMDALEDVIDPMGTVLHVWGSASEDPRDVMATEADVVRAWNVRNLVLGYQRGPGSARWLTNTEISEAVVRAWDGAEEYVVAGTVDPWSGRP